MSSIRWQTVRHGLQRSMRLAGRLDSDLAALYEVPTMVFNQTIQRNAARFPVYFAFQPTREKVANLKSQFVTSRSKGTCALWSQIVILEINGHGQHRKYRPHRSITNDCQASALLRWQSARCAPHRRSLHIRDNFLFTRRTSNR
jgi:hypothetical protein